MAVLQCTDASNSGRFTEVAVLIQTITGGENTVKAGDTAISTIGYY